MHLAGKIAQSIMTKAQKIAFDLHVPHSFLMKVGRSISGEIVQVAKENGCQLILLGYKMDEDPLKNSVIHRVINRQPCDVVILKSDSEENEVTFLRILAEDSGQVVLKKTDEALKRTVKMYNIQGARTEVLKHSRIAEAIAEISGQHDFLILGMRKGAWLKSFFFGLIAQQITGQVRCPTLLTKTKSTSRSGFIKGSDSSEDDSCALD